MSISMTTPDYLAQFRNLGLPKRKEALAIILAEDVLFLRETVTHHLEKGFSQILILAPERLEIPDEFEPDVTLIRTDVFAPDALDRVASAAAEVFAGRWIYVGYNGEFLFYPFCETRSINELIEFHAGEKRDALPAILIDLYSDGLEAAPFGLAMKEACFDGDGYFSEIQVPEEGEPPDPRFLHLFGGLRWRFAEFVPDTQRRTDRIATFRARRGLKMSRENGFSQADYNAWSCPWHRNATTAVMSFRAAKALRSNPASRDKAAQLEWEHSQRFDWTSSQLLEMGIIEPGQWF